MNVLDVCGLQCASFGHWQDTQAEAFTIHNPRESIYRSLLWTDDRVTGAIFAGQANNLGMLTDVGMVKGLIQSAVSLGPWKQYLRENPFDIRRAFIACDVPNKLMNERLLGEPAAARQYRFDGGAARFQPGDFPSAVCADKIIRDLRTSESCALRSRVIVRVKLMGMLKQKSPPDGQLALAEGATIAHVLEVLQIPIDSVHVFTVNGTLERNKQRVLSDGSELTILPPVGGG